jgi:hypothetical protein
MLGRHLGGGGVPAGLDPLEDLPLPDDLGVAH